MVVHSWFWLPSGPSGPGRLEDGPAPVRDPGRIHAGIGEDLAAELASWQEKYPHAPVRQDIVRGHPARVLARYSAHADLVVIGRPGSAPATGAIGRIQHAVLSQARGPVAVIPGAG